MRLEGPRSPPEEQYPWVFGWCRANVVSCLVGSRAVGCSHRVVARPCVGMAASKRGRAEGAPHHFSEGLGEGRWCWVVVFWDESPSQPIHQEQSRTLWQKTHRPPLFYTESNGPWAGVSTDLVLCGSGSSFPCEDSVCPALCGWLQASLLTVWWDMVNLQTMV